MRFVWLGGDQIPQAEMPVRMAEAIGDIRL